MGSVCVRWNYAAVAGVEPVMRSSLLVVGCVGLALVGCDSDSASTGQPNEAGGRVAAPSTEASESTTVSTLSAASSLPTSVPGSNAAASSSQELETIECDGPDALASVAELIRSGQPTFDYTAAVSLKQQVEWADVVVSGELVRAQRVVTGDIDAYTSLTVESMEVLAGNGQVSEIGLSSWWANTDPDPLADAIAFNGVNFVGFLSAVPNESGSWSPAVEGLVFGCGTTSSQTSSWSGHSPESAGISLDALAAEVRAIASSG